MILLGPGEYTGNPVRFRQPDVTVKGQGGVVVHRQLQFHGDGWKVLNVRTSGPYPGDPAGIYNVRAADGEVAGCEFADCFGQAIYSEGDRLHFHDNFVHDTGDDTDTSGDHGCYLSRGSGLVVENNRFERIASFGMQIGPQVHDSTIRGNTVDGANQCGLTVWGGSSGNLVESNTFLSCKAGPMNGYQAGGGNVACNNVADVPWPESINGFTLEGNTVGTALDPEPEPAPDPEPAGLRKQILAGINGFLARKRGKNAANLAKAIRKRIKPCPRLSPRRKR